jgi:methyl-accepting chemotaxis protein
VADLISEVNAGIAAASGAMAASEEKINEVSQIAGEARGAIAQIRASSATTTDFVSAVAASYHSHADSSRSFAEMLSRISGSLARWTTEVETASSDVAQQISILGDLDRTCEELSEVSDRLTLEVARFSKRRA